MSAPLLNDHGVGLYAVRQVTLANGNGELRAGWIPHDAATFVDDVVVIGGHRYTVVMLGPTVTQPTNGLPRWFQAEPWIETEDLCA
jgi:hypothetical protein